MADYYNEHVVMTPAKRGACTIIQVERVPASMLDTSRAAASYAGLVVNDAGSTQPTATAGRQADLQLEFKCWLVDKVTSASHTEIRRLKYYMVPDTVQKEKVAFEFFRDLIKPEEFPRDYVGFVKKVMKLVQHAKYRPLLRVDCEMEPAAAEDQELPAGHGEVVTQSASSYFQAPEDQSSPCVDGGDNNGNLTLPTGLDVDPDEARRPVEDSRTEEERLRDNLLLTLEYAYPNVLSVDDFVRILKCEPAHIVSQLQGLAAKNLVKDMEGGRLWVRNAVDTSANVQIVKQMPVFHRAQQPTIAIVTALYCEKLAVDAMMEEKTTFVRYKLEGESHVYTLGYIGDFRVVSTKLPAIGRQQAAQIASGNTTTRLLGTFSEIEHVLLVGVGGGVPHFMDFHKHVRLGDCIVSVPNSRRYMYYFCDKVMKDERTQELTYTVKGWGASSLELQDAIRQIQERQAVDYSYAPWESFVEEGQASLHDQDLDFRRPPPGSDRLYMNIGEDDVIEVQHPPVPEGAMTHYRPGMPTIRYGQIGCGKPLVKNEVLRQDFAARQNIICFDTEFDQVMESICGNRKDSFLFVRGVSDYLDGSRGKDWQPYASLVAAAVAKSIILSLPSNARGSGYYPS